MAEFSMTCTCGHEMTLEAGSRDEAVEKFKAFMTQDALDQHFAERHDPSETKPTLEMAHSVIEEKVMAAA